MTALTLNRLGEREIAAMIDRVIGNKSLPDEHPAGHHRAHRRHSAVRRGNDQGGAGGGERRRRRSRPLPPFHPGLGGPRKPARLADGAARPARPSQGGGADRGGDRARVLSCLLAAVVRKPEAELQSALDRLIAAGLLFRQGVPPHATYLFKHALVQDAAYGTLLREPRRALHARIAETLESQFAEIAENQPELLARHCTEAGLIEKAAGLWGKAGQRSLERSALVEAVRAAHPCPRPDRDLARHARAASRADQASGRAHNPTHPCQRVCGAGNQGGCGAGTSADRTS